MPLIRLISVMVCCEPRNNDMRFSVVIPLHNKAQYVAKAIHSVLAQTYADFELVIVDDGSVDDSAQAAMQAIGERENCRLIRQENAGVSVARNNGVAASQGEYLCFLDADDWWEPTFLEEMSKLIAGLPEAGVYGTNYTIVNETKHRTRVAHIGVEDGFEQGYINYCQAYARTMYMPLWTGAVCIPRSVFDAMGGFRKGVKLGEDFLLWIHVALRYRVAFLNKPLAYYNQDVEAANRGVGRLYEPKEHMLWNLTDLEPLEGENQDYKQLVDALRVIGLMPYYLSKTYKKMADVELAKVDWNRQPVSKAKEYRKPIGWLRIKYALLKTGAKIKPLVCNKPKKD